MHSAHSHGGSVQSYEFTSSRMHVFGLWKDPGGTYIDMRRTCKVHREKSLDPRESQTCYFAALPRQGKVSFKLSGFDNTGYILVTLKIPNWHHSLMLKYALKLLRIHPALPTVALWLTEGVMVAAGPN